MHAQTRPLSEGKLDGSTVTCPWHGAQFNVCTGAVLRGPAKEPLKTYDVVVDGEVGHVEVPQPLNRTGFVGGLIPREDGAHGTTKQVLT